MSSDAVDSYIAMIEAHAPPQGGTWDALARQKFRMAAAAAAPLLIDEIQRLRARIATG